MRFVYQSFLLALSFLLVFLWQNTPLSLYTIQTLGFLIILYLFFATRKKGFKGISLGGDTIWTIFILNTIILLLVFSTGGFSSMLFFLLYFLGFGISFALEPATVFVFVIGIVALFFPLAVKDDVFRNLIMLGSLVLLSPLSFFFGQTYTRTEKDDRELARLRKSTGEKAEKIHLDVSHVLKKEKGNLKLGDAEKLNDALWETAKLRQEVEK